MATLRVGRCRAEIVLSVVCLSAAVFCEEYIMEFEKEDNFWTEIADGSQNPAKWRRIQWKQGECCVPEPAGDRWLLGLTPSQGEWSSTARVRSRDLLFTDGAFMNITFWITSEYSEASNLRVFKTSSEGSDVIPAFWDLTKFSIPDNKDWRQEQRLIQLDTENTEESFRLTIYGYMHNNNKSGVMIDRIVVNTDGKSPEQLTTSSARPEVVSTTPSGPEVITTTSSVPGESPTTSKAPDTITTTSSAPKVATTISSTPGITTTSSNAPDVTTTTSRAQGIATTISSTPEITTTSSNAPDVTTTSRAQEIATTSSVPEITTKMPTAPKRTTTEISATTEAILTTVELAGTASASLGTTTEEAVSSIPTGLPSGAGEESEANTSNAIAETITGLLGALGILLFLLFFVALMIKKPETQEDQKILVISGPIKEETALPKYLVDKKPSNLLQKKGSVLSLQDEPDEHETTYLPQSTASETQLPASQNSDKQPGNLSKKQQGCSSMQFLNSLPTATEHCSASHFIPRPKYDHRGPSETYRKSENICHNKV